MEGGDAGNLMDFGSGEQSVEGMIDTMIGAAAFPKTSGDTLKIFVNHTLLGV